MLWALPESPLSDPGSARNAPANRQLLPVRTHARDADASAVRAVAQVRGWVQGSWRLLAGAVLLLHGMVAWAQPQPWKTIELAALDDPVAALGLSRQVLH